MSAIMVMDDDEVITMNENSPSHLNGNSPVSDNSGTARNERNSIKRGIGSADDYQKHKLRDHIYKVQDTYIGSDDQIPREDRILDLSNPDKPQFKYDTISLPEGVERLYLEILSNAGDNVQKSRESGIDIGKIEIMMDKKIVSIRNGGRPIPVQINSQTKTWAPDMIMGNLLTSSNYNEERTGAGRNGYGAKLANIFSKVYSIIVGDPYNKKKYTQTWTENMTIRGEPIIEDGYDGEPFVNIIYQMDFERFKYTEYPDETFGVFARHAADIAFTCKVPVIFNGVNLNAQNVYEYTSWMFPDKSNILVHYEWPSKTETKNKKFGQSLVPIAVDKNVMPLVELAVIDTPDEGSMMAYVNGIVTKDGGVHVEKAYRAIGDSVLTMVNDSMISKKKSGDKTANKSLKLDISSIKRHVTIIMSCRLMNPKFTSQQKTKLSSPSPTIKIQDKSLAPVLRWELVTRLHAELEAKMMRALGKTDGKKTRRVKIAKAEDANFAGDPKRARECTLCVTEGDSAATYAIKMFSNIEGGRNIFGAYPMKGKPLNVMGASPLKILANKEICELKEILGLREGVDYSDESNFNTLRYGHLMILADSDVDGKHICGLILNIFYCRFPSLLRRGYVSFLRTPIVRVWKGSEKLKFYTQSEYETWKDQIDDVHKWTHKYFKGLGSSSNDDVKDDTKNPRIIAFIYDDTTPQYFSLAFHPKHANARKEWLERYQQYLNIESIQMLPISMFINYEMIEHSITNVGRSVPGFDGLKKSQRKIIWGSMLKWGAKTGKSTANSMKTIRLTSAIAELTNYHYGERSLVEAVNHMTLDYAGTNNLPPFCQDGQFGSRNHNGGDAADARYTSTKPQWWWPYMFRKEDHDSKNRRPYLVLVEDEGQSWEPVTMLPILPMALINGARGIGTGYSTFIPNYDPLDLCDWLKQRIYEQDLRELKPWYRHFTGIIEVRDRQRIVKTKDDEDLDTESIQDDHDQLEADDQTDGDRDSDTELDPSNPLGSDTFEVEMVDLGDGTKEVKMSMLTKGLYHLKKDGIHITELPLERSIHDYDVWLRLLEEQKIISKYDNLSKADNPYFIVKGMKNPSVKKLRLEKSFGLTNMVLLDPQDKPIRFENEKVLMEQWYQWRLPYYEARRDFMITSITETIKNKNDKIRFIRAVIDGTTHGPILGQTIVVLKKRKTEIYPQMDAMNIPQDLLKMTNLSNCTEDEIQHLMDEITKLEHERQHIIDTSAKQLWLNDITEFEQEYQRQYKIKSYKESNAIETISGDPDNSGNRNGDIDLIM